MQTTAGIALNWLLRLRWWVIACQILLVLAIVTLFHAAMPYEVFALILGFALVSNLYFHYLVRHREGVGEKTLMVVMFLDIALLTALLYTTGGPMNPFTFLYLVHISLGSILLPPRWAVALAFFATICYAVLFFLPTYIPSRDLGLASLNTVFAPCHVDSAPTVVFGREISPHLQGMWVAFAITALFIVFFVGQAYKALARHRQALHQLRDQQRKSERLASLATLAAGAAHELSTPLATIAVAAGEMRHLLKEGTKETAPPGSQKTDLNQTAPELITDLELIRNQVERCRDILYHLGAEAGEHHAELTERIPLSLAVEQAMSTFSAQQRQRIMLDNRASQLLIKIPRRTISRVLRALLKNALEASAPELPVELICRVDEGNLVIEARDRGQGMSREVQERAGEPFFTTKEVGQGMGLGLFLAKSAAEHFGGGLEIESAPGEGSLVTLKFALSRITDTERQ